MTRITVQVDDQTYHVPAGTRISEIFGAVFIEEHEVVAAALSNHLVGLDTTVDGDATIRPVAATAPEGQGVVQRTASLLLHVAARRRLPAWELQVGQSLLGGHFYEVTPPRGTPPEAVDLEAIARALTDEIEALAASDTPLERRGVPVEGARRVLTRQGDAKDKLLDAWPSRVVSVVSLGDFADIAHGPYAATTRHGAGARVVPYPPGLLLLFPGTDEAPTQDRGRRLWDAYHEARSWNRRIGAGTLGALNAATLQDRLEDVIRVAEAFHEKKVAAIADEVAARRDDVRFVCIAGPSSAGKTTFVMRLKVQLQVNGFEPVILNLDNYYRDRSECPRDAHGDYDFEALEALDVPLLHEHLAALHGGEAVRVPKFDFTHGVRAPEATWSEVQLGARRILLIEGIHGLNPELTRPLPRQAIYRIFINALTQLVVDEHNRISTTDTRLIRRIVRDRRYRGTGACDTIARWPSVRRGEELHIYPFQDEADVVFNSALVYELSVLRTFAWRYLLEVPRHHPSRVQAYRLLKFLEMFVPVFPDGVPANSVLREFIGGSDFSY